jgi:hypothetical protein
MLRRLLHSIDQKFNNDAVQLLIDAAALRPTWASILQDKVSTYLITAYLSGGSWHDYGSQSPIEMHED